MSAMTTTLTDADAQTRARLRDLFAAEWLKLWSLRSTRWGLLISALVVIGFNVGIAENTVRYWYQNDPASRASYVSTGLPLLDAYTTDAGILAVVAAGAFGAVAISGEFGTGLIRVTFAAVPARRSVMAAKMGVLAAVMTVFGALVAAVSFAATQAILAQRHANASIGSPNALRVVVASSLLVPVCALAGAAIGAIVRRSAAAVAAAVVLLQVLPVIIGDHGHWAAVIGHTLPYEAWLQLVTTAYGQSDTTYPWSLTSAWIIFAVWTLAAVLVAVVAEDRRDL